MENQFSNQDKTINEGVRALREMSIDTSNMVSILAPHRKRSIALPVGLATAVACVAGAIVMFSPSKAVASPFLKVQEAVRKQDKVYEKIFQRGAGDKWVLRLETLKDGKSFGAKWGAVGDGYQYVVRDGKKYEKASGEASIRVSSAGDFKDVGIHGQAIHEILAREGMEFIGIKRSQTRGGRRCDIYRLNFKREPHDLLFYVDPKTDLPFLQEVVDRNGKVLNKVEIEFPVEIRVRRVEAVEVKEGEYRVEVDAKVDLFEVRLDSSPSSKHEGKSQASVITVERVTADSSK